MTNPTRQPQRSYLPVAAILAVGCLFFIASIDTPLIYFQNQNTKFLHGLASALPDRLGADWTACTVDGLPLFTALVHAVAAWSSPLLFYVIEAGLLAVMCASLVGLSAMAAPRNGHRTAFVALACGLMVILVHASQEDSLRGVAEQYMTRGYLQPSEFGILFLPVLWLAIRRHPSALLLAVVPAAFHPTYIVFSVITIGVILWDRHRAKLPLPRLLLAIAVVLLVLPPLDIAIRFAPTDAETFSTANAILAFERIPHHSDPLRWASWDALRKAVIAGVALVVAPPGVMRALLAVLLTYALGGTVFVAVTGNAEIALLAPWRVSIVIIPVAVAILVGWGLDRLLAKPRAWVPVAGIVAAWASWAAWDGLSAKWNDINDHGFADHIAHIRESHVPTDVYLTPPTMSDFRLEAMTAQFVSWKTHPYLDTEIIAWNRRAKLAARVYAGGGFNCDALADIRADYDVSHVLVPADAVPASTCPGLREVFSGKKFTIMGFAPT